MTSEHQKWAEILSTDPEIECTQKKQQVTYTWSEENAGFEFSLDPVRVNLRVFPRIALRDSADLAPFMGSFEKAHSAFLEKCVLWFKHAPPLMRLAFGAMLGFPHKSRDDAYSHLNGLLHDVRVQPEARDFEYQVNYPRSSKVCQDVKLNRLMKWSVDKIRVTAKATTAGHTVDLPGSGLIGFWTILVLDINNEVSESERTLPQDQLLSLFEEFGELGLEIVEFGDTK